MVRPFNTRFKGSLLYTTCREAVRDLQSHYKEISFAQELVTKKDIEERDKKIAELERMIMETRKDRLRDILGRADPEDWGSILKEEPPELQTLALEVMEEVGNERRTKQ